MKTIRLFLASPRWLAALGRSLKPNRATVCALLFVPVVAGVPASLPAQPPVTLTTLSIFNGSNGAHSHSALVQGSDGNFYGTTTDGGPNDTGTIFSVTPSGTQTILHTFSASDASGGTPNSDGAHPNAELVQAPDGNFYGTATSGGSAGQGAIFRITPAGVFTTLYSFSQLNLNYANNDGAYPFGGLAVGRDGNLYGTAELGGTGGTGTIFSITTDGVFTVLHNFAADNSDGGSPLSTLALGRDGNFYGTTYNNAAGNFGTVFSVTPAGRVTTLHNFSAVDSHLVNSDGAKPFGGLVQGKDGNFYAMTNLGGSGHYGTIYSITPAGTFTTLHNFSDLNSEGVGGTTTLALGSDGNLYGATSYGGSGGKGTIFSMTTAGVYTVLHSFAADNSDGGTGAALVLGKDGNFYGTTLYGGAPNYEGTIFKLTALPTFFTSQTSLGGSVYYLTFPGNSNIFGYYSFYDAADAHYLYHYDLGFEYVFDANDGHGGVYLYDFTSNTFWYTSPTFAFPYLYDFSLRAFLYYYPDPTDPNRYNTNGVRYFYNFSTGKVISK